MNSRILNTILKTGVYLSQYKNILVSISGGSDSDIILDLVESVKTDKMNIHYVFVNTGLEYRATLNHLKYLEKRYNISIERIRGESIVTVVKKNGIPLISKEFSTLCDYYKRGLSSAQTKLNKTGKYAISKKHRELLYYVDENDIKVSSKCCNLSKKKPLHDYYKANKIDLVITGERQAEGGIRVSAHKSCFEEYNSTSKTAKYMPLWFWSDEDKISYEIDNNIVHSDCYTLYGMKRTGCVGCPYNSRIAEDLEKIKIYEPNLYKACMNVFGDAYKLHDMFNIRKKKVSTN